jgi:hypothetical protein
VGLLSSFLLIDDGFLETAGNKLRFPVGIGDGGCCCRDLDPFKTLVGELNLALVFVCCIIILFFKVEEELKCAFFVL